MTFSDTAMMELGITQSTNIHNTRSLIRTLKYVLDILQTEEAFTVEEYKHTHTHAVVSLRIQSECGKMQTRITLNTDTFYTVYTCLIVLLK